MYTEARWKELIPLAKEGIEMGHDFYYIRMRLGIAYFEGKNYTKAIKHFKNALEFDQGSTDAWNYLNLCYQYLGREKEAIKYYNVTKEKSKFFNSFYFEPGIKITDNSTSTRDVRYFFLGLNHNLGRSVSLFHGYQHLASDFAAIINSGGGAGPGPGGWSSASEYLYTAIQNEYYAALSILAAKGFYIIPAFHFQGVAVEGYSGTNYVTSIQLAKWLGRVKLYGGYYNSEINEGNQQQIEGGMIYYPLGNANFYLQASAMNHTENSNNTMIWFGKTGIKVLKKTWIDFSYTSGDMLNYSESNGYLLYNQLDMIKSKWGISINQYLGGSLLSLSYVRENKEEYITEIPFIHHDVVLGLNLNF